MTQTIADAKARQGKQKSTGPTAMIEKYSPDLSIVLPSHIRADTWLRVAMSAARKSAKLWTACNASPETMMAALYHAARLGLEPGTDEYYLTPRRNKNEKWEVLGIVGYRGEVELIYRGGAVASVIVCEVRAGDVFRWRPGEMDRPTHRPKTGDGLEWFGSDRGETVGAYAYAIMKVGGVSNVVIADQRRIQRAMAASATAGTSYSPWKTDYGAMVLKTAAHDLEPWVPTSAEYREALREDARASAGVILGKTTARLDEFVAPPGVIDGEIVDPDEHGPHPAEGDDTGEQHAEEPARPDPADPASHPVGQTQMRKIFALLKARGITSDEARMRVASHALDRDITTFKDLSADDASRLITRLEQADRGGEDGTADESAPDAEPTPHADDEGA